MWKTPLLILTTLVVAAIAVLAAAFALPYLAEATQTIRTALTRPATTAGLVFVESPEVYTRQRLVNDRYGQDAWLRAKLAEIDDPDTSFIDIYSVQQQFRDAGITLSLGPAAAASPQATDTTPGQPVIPDSADLSFRTRFDLQSAARDEIRQRILENALDDRHDLSGNTVFGLKFDTAVLPGANTVLSPAVIVKMTSNPLDALHRSLEDLAPLYGRWSSPISLHSDLDPDGTDITTVQTLDRHFDKWRSSIEQRLNDHKNVARGDLCAVNRGLVMADRTLCTGTVLAPSARDFLAKVFAETHAVDDALSYVLRLPPEKISIGTDFLNRVYDEAGRDCATGDADITIEHFLAKRPKAQPFQLPLPWGQLFQLKLRHLQAEDELFCKVAINLTLDGLEVPLAFVTSDPAPASPGTRKTGPDDPSQAGWLQVDCDADACADRSKSIWVEPRSQSLAASTKEAVDSVLTRPALEALLTKATGSQLCFGRASEYDPWFYFGATAPAESSGYASSCFPGDSIQLRLGAYYFLRRMTEVESYTYAAFPRGDVTGVVTETLSTSSVAGRLDGVPGLSARATVGDAARARQAEAQPSMINFASGRGGHDNKGDLDKLFDFGWAIVKDGPKQPMMASQLVIVSVPAYLDSLELDVWQGFLDIDNAPYDRSAFNDLVLDDRIPALMPSFEKRHFRLNLPPDYSALDGLVIGSNLVTGPRINQNALRDRYRLPACGDLSLVIPGERLWRSTVVTLDDVKADKIEVMPDMLGILATFRTDTIAGLRPDPRFIETVAAAAPPPPAASADPQAAQTTRLTPALELSGRLAVWTSEGDDHTDLTFSFRAADCALTDAALDGRN
ncbi:hypothetical protein [Pseudoruegeria sp. SK021]|uniref:hypothetical protein n=1 Tax=Pseudoruegeria sp. SK021 TaxID=1933035 RepID=UPI000A22A3E0|nr:hypothetical protein [Pseudoruegeria sp. SK021]OSP55480.1 hypothetical protein BV911_07490 [Pseudoruegeria sp. SK021]